MLVKKIRKWPLSVAFVAYKIETTLQFGSASEKETRALPQNFKDSGKGSKE